MSEQPFEHLAYQNRFVKHLVQPLEGVDCFQESALLNPENNLITLKLSETEFVKMYSSLLTGADICYPDESLQIVANFLKGIHCPPELVAHECMEYPTYANFMGYAPMNPFINPDTIPDGYLIPPFVAVTEENQGEYPDLQINDVVVPFGAITFDANWFEDLDGVLPTVTIQFQGEGKVGVKLLTIPQGGLAIITLDNPPNLAEILAGIITGADNIVDVNKDIVSLPPETADEIDFPVEVVGEGIHTIYVVFFPIIDDSLIPVRFGGGYRGAELCGFQELPEMGIQDVRIRLGGEGEPPYVFEKQNLGAWTSFDEGCEFSCGWIPGITQRATHAETIAVALRETEDFTDPENSDFYHSPLKTYIDNAAQPFDPSALEAAIAAAQADADAAADAAAAAQSTANGAVNVNNTQNTAIQGQATAIGSLQTRMTTAENNITVLTGDVVNLYSRVTTLEGDVGALAFGGIWAWFHDMTTGSNGYILGGAGSGWVSGSGWQSNANGLEIVYNAEQIKENQIGWIQIVVRYTSAATGSPEWKVNDQNLAIFDYNGIGVDSVGWYQLPPSDFANLTITLLGSGAFFLRSVRYLGRGTSLPFN